LQLPKLPNYIINKNNNGLPHLGHVIHDISVDCGHWPKKKNRVKLGWQTNGFSALEEAEALGFKPVDGCYYCCQECHRHNKV
tara:strand:+ start:84 stop:329 length:246 start_codon:yes stop_codon:yes gene_type:complete